MAEIKKVAKQVCRALRPLAACPEQCVLQLVSKAMDEMIKDSDAFSTQLVRCLFARSCRLIRGACGVVSLTRWTLTKTGPFPRQARRNRWCLALRFCAVVSLRQTFAALYFWI
jgi:hypothetical protein